MSDEQFWREIKSISKNMKILGHIERDIKIPDILVADGKEEFVERYMKNTNLWKYGVKL